MALGLSGSNGGIGRRTRKLNNQEIKKWQWDFQEAMVEPANHQKD